MLISDIAQRERILRLRFAIDSQNISYYHNQFGIPVGTAEGFGYTTSTFNGYYSASALPL